MGIQFNPLLPEVRLDPYPHYHQLRSEEPVQWNELFGAGLGTWVLSRHADVVFALRDPRFSADRSQATINQQAEPAPEQELGPLSAAQTMLTADPPDHTRLRTLVSKAFTPQSVEAVRPRVRQLVEELLDAVADAGRMDVIADLAYPLPVIVIAEMLGIPPADRERFKRWSDDIVVTLDPIVPPDKMQRAQGSAAELVEYLTGIFDARRREPQEDLISGLLAAEEQGDRLSEQELYAMCMLLLIAGNETTTNLIGNGMLALLRNPDQLQRLRDDPSLIASAVEELLRYDAPVQFTARVAAEELQIDDRRVAAGDMVLTLLGAANRDPAQFPDPDRLDLGRRDNRHVAFGFGLHFCLGAPLARLEGQTAIGALVQRLPDLELLTEAPEWRETFTLRGLKSLPAGFTRG